MAMRTPSLQNNSLVGINREIGSQFDVVKTVADNIEDVVAVANATATTQIVADNIATINAIGTDMADIVVVSENIADVRSVNSNMAVVTAVASNLTDIDNVLSAVVPVLPEILLADDNAATATAMASTATTQAGLADTARVAAEAARGIANTKASEAAASAVAADASADLAAASAVLAANESALAHKWSDNAEDVPVRGTVGVDDEYSAYHWAKKAEAVAGGHIQVDNLYDVDSTGVVDKQVLRYDAAGTADKKWIPTTLDKAYVGLGAVDNTADSTKDVLSATKLKTARAIQLSGDVTGTVNFDGSASVNMTTAVGDNTHSHGDATITDVAWSKISSKPDPVVTVTLTGDVTGSANATLTDLGNGTISVATAIAANSVALGTDTTGNYVAGITQGTGITISGTAGEGWSPTVAITNVGTAGTYTKVTTNAQGQVTSGTTLSATDIPSLDASKITSGTIDAARLPSYVDDVQEYTNLTGFPATGETGKIYVAKDTNKTYRWSGSAYVYITSGAVDSVNGQTGVVNITTITGNAGTATKLATARTISLTGDVTGSVSFDGSADAAITATIAANSVALGTDTTGNYVADVVAGNGITIVGAIGEGWSPTIAHADTSSATSVASNNSNGVVIQDVTLTLDTYGHATAASVGTVDLDNRYYTKTEVDTIALNTTANALAFAIALG